MMLISGLAGMGLLLSMYAWYVNYRSLSDQNYSALCDINESISCTKAFTSPYGKLLGFSNTLKGIVFYTILLALHSMQMTQLVFYASFIAVLFSCYLAYLLYCRIRTFCFVCTSIYLINVGLLIASYLAI